MDVEPIRFEGLKTETRFDALGNGEVMIESRSQMSIIVHTISKDEAIVLMEWLSRATL